VSLCKCLFRMDQEKRLSVTFSEIRFEGFVVFKMFV